MAVILDKHKIFYGAVPKTACSSLKLAFFELENGFPFKPFVSNGRSRHIHNSGYATLPRAKYPEERIKDYFRVAMVREPISRFLSAYGNRVIAHKELSMYKAEEGLTQANLEPTPDLDLYIERFHEYRRAHPSILHHTRPSAFFLGTDASYFTKLYTPADMDQFVADIAERTGTTMTVGRAQTGGPKFKVDDLTRKQQNKIKKLYKEDYKTFGKFF